MSNLSDSVYVSYAERINLSNRIIFQDGNPELYEKLNEVTQKLRRECEMIENGQSENLLTICLAGELDVFKRELLDAILGSDFNAEDQLSLEEGVLWIGDKKPTGNCGDFLHIDSSDMLRLGRPYALAYCPSHTDLSKSSQRASKDALLSANIKILGLRHESVRDGAQARLFSSIDGALILPVIRFDPKASNCNGGEIGEDTKIECRKEIEKWRLHASDTKVLEPLFVPDLAILGDKEEFDVLVRSGLLDRLEAAVCNLEQLEKHKYHQIKACMHQAERKISELLSDFRNRLGDPIKKLVGLEQQLGGVIAEGIIGDNIQLRIGLRSRFRMDVTARTSPAFFPYRSLLGVLGITHGAWDRLIFSSLGSLPSVLMTTRHSLKSILATKNFEKSLQELTKTQIEAKMSDAYEVDIRNFYNALSSANPVEMEGAIKPDFSRLINIRGITSLQVACQKCLVNVVEKRKLPLLALLLGGCSATLIFCCLLGGPVISLYISYMEALSRFSLSGNWQAFPSPPASLWISSLLLSLAPVFFIAMVVMGIACRKGKVKEAADEFTINVNDEIQKRLKNSQLVIELKNERLDAARHLLSFQNES